MPNAAAAIYARLSNDATLSNLLNGGIHAGTPKELPQRPYIAYSLVNQVERLHSMDGDASLVIDRYQVDIYADDYAGMISVDDQVRALLSRWSGTAGGTTVDSVLLTDRQDLYEDDPELFRRTNDYVIAWRE